MAQPNQSDIRNRLLATMRRDDFALLAPQLTRFELDRDTILTRADEPMRHVWFLESGMSSTVTATLVGENAEVGVVGHDGMIDPSVILGSNRSRFLAFMQLPGAGYRLDVEVLRQAFSESRALHEHLLGFVHVMLVQISYTALSNATHTIEERLARWLLMCHDCSEGDELNLTHDFLSLMLAVRRPSVTVALHILEGEHLISAKRSRITIRDREGLIGLAGDAYRKSAQIQRELFGNGSTASARSAPREDGASRRPTLGAAPAA